MSPKRNLWQLGQDCNPALQTLLSEGEREKEKRRERERLVERRYCLLERERESNAVEGE
jgi:hypothetical protein